MPSFPLPTLSSVIAEFDAFPIESKVLHKTDESNSLFHVVFFCGGG